MKNAITIDQVSKEVKTKISKLGKEALIKKYLSGLFDSQDQVIGANYYLLKRGTSEFELEEANQQFYAEYFETEADIATTTTTTKGSFGKHASQMSEEEISQAEAKRAQIVQSNKDKRVQEDQSKVNEDVVVVPEPAAKKDKKELTPIIKLTEQESILFEKIKELHDPKNNKQIFHNIFTSLREYKGVLGSLRKKNIISYDNDQNTLSISETGLQMLDGTLPYKQKTKHEQNFFRKTRVVVEIEGKKLEKSAYVRTLLRKNKNITCSELNILLAAAGYAKLYHSELQRCKEQLGIVTDKKKD
jgi:hypothetical protein